MRSSKSSQKTSFCCLDAAIMMPVHTVFFTLLSLAKAFVLTYENNFSMSLILTKKNQDIHIEEFFYRFYLSQNHRYHKIKYIFIILNRGPMHEAGHADNGAIVQVAF